MINSLLAKLNSKNKEFVGVSLSPNGCLEIIQVSRVEKRVLKYTNRYVAYDPIKKAVESYDALASEVESGLTALGLNPRECNVILSLPNVLFGVSNSVPAVMSSAEEITGIITSEAEDSSYILKTEEPIVSWVKLSSAGDYQKIAYTAIQDVAIREIKETFDSIGVTLISIQNTYATMLGGLVFSGKLERIVKDCQYWSILLITGSSFSIFNFNESSLVNYYEEPLAVKSINSTEVYNAVSSMAVAALQNYSSSKLLIVSETDDISAEIMASKISAESYYVEQNKYQQNPIIETSYDILPNLANQISASAIGAGVDYAGENLFSFNYLETAEGFKSVETPDIINIGGKAFELTTQKAKNITILAVVAIAVFVALICGLFNGLGGKVKADVKKYTAEEKKLQDDLKQYNVKPVKKANVVTSMNYVIDSNRKKMLYYDSLSYGIPDELWVEYFEVSSNGGLSINGVAMNSSDITSFLRGIKEVSGETGVSLTKLAVINEEDILNLNGQDVYTFELSAGGVAAPVVKQEVEEEKPTKKTRVSRKKRSTTPPANMPSLAPPVRILND